MSDGVPRDKDGVPLVLSNKLYAKLDKPEEEKLVVTVNADRVLPAGATNFFAHDTMFLTQMLEHDKRVLGSELVKKATIASLYATTSESEAALIEKLNDSLRRIEESFKESLFSGPLRRKTDD